MGLSLCKKRREGQAILPLTFQTSNVDQRDTREMVTTPLGGAFSTPTRPCMGFDRLDFNPRIIGKGLNHCASRPSISCCNAKTGEDPSGGSASHSLRYYYLD